MELREGVVIAGRFRLERELGHGAMGVVWRARHLGLDIPCAVKLIREMAANSPEHVARFEREAKAAAQIRSPHVVQLLDHGVWEGVPYMAMELLEGEDLEARLERTKKLRPEEAITLFRPIAKALKKAHDMGLVHRDLKPANIFLAKDADDEVPKILDFGIVKDRGQETQTRVGAILGTPYYLSPEQARSSRDIDHRSDLWSFAVMIYRCVVGRLPFTADTLGDLITQIVVSPLPVPSHYADVPPAFDAWWARATTRDPAQRFQSAVDLVEAFAAAFGVQPGATAGPSTVSASAPGVSQAPGQSAGYGQSASLGPQGFGAPPGSGAPGGYGHAHAQGASPGYGAPPGAPGGYGQAHTQSASPGYGAPPGAPGGYGHAHAQGASVGYGAPQGPIGFQGGLGAPASQPKKGPPWLAIGLGCGGLTILSGGFLMCVALAGAGAGAGATGAGGYGSGLTPCGGPNILCTASKLSDPAHVDPVETLAIAREAAIMADPQVKLTNITVTGVQNGTVAVSDVLGVTYVFAAPGVSISVTVKKGQTVVFRGAPLPSQEAIADPTCSGKAAWKAAVAAGLEENVPGTFLYSYETTVRGPKMQLSTNRALVSIDPVTCAVRQALKW